jgi:hypothetical protein
VFVRVRPKWGIYPKGQFGAGVAVSQVRLVGARWCPVMAAGASVDGDGRDQASARRARAADIPKNGACVELPLS